MFRMDLEKYSSVSTLSFFQEACYYIFIKNYPTFACTLGIAFTNINSIVFFRPLHTI